MLFVAFYIKRWQTSYDTGIASWLCVVHHLTSKVKLYGIYFSVFIYFFFPKPWKHLMCAEKYPGIMFLRHKNPVRIFNPKLSHPIDFD